MGSTVATGTSCGIVALTNKDTTGTLNYRVVDFFDVFGGVVPKYSIDAFRHRYVWLQYVSNWRMANTARLRIEIVTILKKLAFERLQTVKLHAIQFIVQVGPRHGCQQTDTNAGDG